MKYLYLFFVFAFLVSPCNIVQAKNLDSLWGVWQDETQHDTNRVRALHNVIWYKYLFTDPDSAFYFSQIHYDFAKNIGNKKEMASALNKQALVFFYKGDYKQSIEFHNNSLKIKKEINDQKGIAVSLLNLGLVYRSQGNYAKAISYYTDSRKQYESINDQKGIASCLNNIGIIHHSQGDYDKTIDYFTQSLKISEEADDKAGIASQLINLGNVLKQKGELEKALSNYEKCLIMYAELNDIRRQAIALSNIGSVKRTMGEFSEAMEYYLKNLTINEKLGNKKGMASTYGNMANVELQQSNIKKAIEYGNKSVNIAQEIGASSPLRDGTVLLSEAYRLNGNYQKAFEMYKLHIATRDSMESEANQKEVIRQEYKYTYEKESALQEKEHQSVLLVEKTKQEQQQIIIIMSIISLIGVIIMFRILAKKFKVTKQQKLVIEEKSKEITDSILYAKRIQAAILPPDKNVKQHLPQSFILYKPKDIVAGDFYWMEAIGNKTLFAAADCTGHGVPGAMVSVICNNGLNRSVREYGLTSPGEILDKTRDIVIQEFEKSEEEVKDGMDIALCSLEGNKLQYAGAHNPLWIIRNGELTETKANKQPIGKFDNPTPYTTQNIELQPGDSFYIFSDGFADQFGGEKGKKLKTANFKKLLLSIQKESMTKQKQLINDAFEKWKGDLEQLDDVCVIGVRI